MTARAVVALARLPGARFAGARVPPLLRGQVLRRYWAGQTISLFGDQISAIALPLTAVLVLHAGAVQMGYLSAAVYLPSLLLALHAGAWADRRRSRRGVMLAADAGRAAILLSIPAAYASGALTLGQLYAVAFCCGALQVAFNVADASLFVSIVPPTQYVQASSLMYGSRAMSFVGGPSLGGLLVQLVTAPLALAADAVSFLASAASLWLIRPDEPHPERLTRGGTAAGARFILRSAIVRPTLAATTTINFFNLMFSALFVLYATRSLHVPPGVLGLVLGAGAVGAVLGSVVTGRLTERLGVGWTCVAGCALFPAPLLLVPLAGGPRPVVLGLLFLAEFGSGVGVMMLDISYAAIRSAVVPHRLQARVSGAFQAVNYGVRPFGSLVGGALGASLGLRPALWIAAGGAVLGVLWVLPSPLPRLRTLPTGGEQQAGRAAGGTCGGDDPRHGAEDRSHGQRRNQDSEKAWNASGLDP